MAQEVFICHSSADAAVARDICDHLEGSGVGCWIAPRDPVPGIPWGQQIVNAIAAARVVLLVFSPHANDSQPVLNEVELAANRRKIILPVRIADVAPSVSLEFYLRAIHWFDAATRPLDDAWSQLIADVQSLVAPEQSPGESIEGSSRAARAPNNLPSQVTTFVGREQSMAEIAKLLRTNRLVTMVGSGGAGKTRTAIEVGSALLGEFPDGVWLVELAPVSNGSLVAGTIARVLGVRESMDRPTLDALLEELRLRRALLVIDNCEQVIDDVRIVANAILRTCPALRILATSRESLNIAGERVFRLPSLAVPPPSKSVTARAAMQYGAVTLFVDRALASDGRFTLTDDNAGTVAEICRRLDGIPLAIELAAARIKVLSPQQLAQRLDERFRVLTGGDRSALPRHQTMRALIDWSYDLLSDPERALFRRLSIFAAGFTLEGATSVCGDEGCDEIAVLDLLSSLVDKSLLQADPGAEERYRLLESTRQYAREKLVEAGEFESCANRHLAYLAELFKKSGEKYEMTMSGTAIADLAPELEDARYALEWAERHAVTEAADFFLATSLWAQLGLNREAIARAQRLVELLGEDDYARLARLWERIAFCSENIGRGTVALDGVERALRYARESGDTGVIADCLLRYADVLARARRFDDAFAVIDEAESFGPSSMRRDQQVLYVRALTELICGDLDAASASFARSREVFAAAGNDAGMVSVSLNLAEVDHARGATNEAIEIVRSALPSAEKLPDRNMWALLMRNLAGYLGAVGDAAGARRAAREAIEFYGSDDPEGPLAATSLEHLALALALDGDFERAAILEGYSDATFRRLGFEREYTERKSHERLLELLNQRVQQAELTDLLARGRRMGTREAFAASAYADAIG
jgi:predicted ATPase